jgi:hypothetical protein
VDGHVLRTFAPHLADKLTEAGLGVLQKPAPLPISSPSSRERQI